MGMIEQVKVKARQCVKTIVLPEGDEPRTVQAAVKIVQEKIARPILLGDPARVKAVATEKGVDVSNIEIVNPLTSPKAAEYTNALYELRKAKGVTPEKAADMIKNPLFFAAMMIMNHLWVDGGVPKEVIGYIADIATTVTFWEAMTILIVENAERRSYLANLARRFESIAFRKKSPKE
jgi:phosphotransacetylase